MPESLSQRLLSIVVTLFAIAIGVPVTIFFGTVAILLGWIPPRGNVMLWCARAWSRILLFLTGTRVDARFEEELAPERSYVYLANHQSYFDILVLLSTVPSQVRFAAKASLFRIPIFGWALTVGGFIPIDRSDRSRARKAFAAAASRLQGGASVLFFPEGTRSRDGEFGKFERGGFLLALRSGLPIVPVGVRGAREVLTPGTLWIRPGRTIRLSFGSEIHPAEYGIRRREELVADVRTRIAELAEIPLVS